MLRRLHPLSFGLALVACDFGQDSQGDNRGGPPPSEQPSSEEPVPWTSGPPVTVALTCRPVVGASFRGVDPTRPTRWRAHGYEANGVGGTVLKSLDSGLTWDRALVYPGPLAAYAGPIVVTNGAMRGVDMAGALAVSPDGGETWQRLVGAPSTRPDMPPGTVESDLGEGVRLAWMPTQLLRYSLDDGQTWAVEPDAYYGVADETAPRSAVGDREWVVTPQQRIAYRTRDRGLTWSRIEVPAKFTTIALVGDHGVVAGVNATIGSPSLWVSRDDGATWTERPRLMDDFTIGPEDGELWATKYFTTGEVAITLRSLDWGATFSEVTFDVGGAALDDISLPRRLDRSAEGRRVGFSVIAEGGLNRMTCAESATGATGAIIAPEPAQDDRPANATLWSRGIYGGTLGSHQRVIPLSEPGQTLSVDSPPFSGYFAIRGGNRTVDGKAAYLVQPSEYVGIGLPFQMEVRVVDPITRTVVKVEPFDDLALERGGSLELEAFNLYATPNGGFRTDTYFGNFEINTPLQYIDGRTSNGIPTGARWGRNFGSDFNDLAVVTRIEVGDGSYRFQRFVNFTDLSLPCDETSSVANCLRYPAEVRDWAYRDGRLYLLDAFEGRVVEARFDGGQASFRTVLFGLANAETLFVPIDEDLGIYVIDDHLFRFVPGEIPVRRP